MFLHPFDLNQLWGKYELNKLVNGNKCPFCNNTANEFTSDFFTYDFERAELICNECGAVLKNQDIPTIEDLQYRIFLDSQFEKPANDVPTLADLIQNVINDIEAEKQRKREKRKQKKKQ